ncbi:MAG: hypothetical protein GTO14_19865 [Anaerolineales bacterium]|nr:hypothetical protein [Anaerolineales bacterium]
MIRFGSGELVVVCSTSKDVMPSEFTWRGQRHRVRSIDRYQTNTYRQRNGVEQLRLFRLRTTRGMRCLLSQDVSRGIWRMERILDGKGGLG